MARPVKEGLEYFPMNSNIFHDRKIKKLIKNFKNDGLSIFFCLLCEVYRDKGYYVEYGEDLFIDVASMIDNVEEGKVKEICDACIEYGLFDLCQFKKNNILTSNGIQKRYKTAKRAANIKNDFLVIAEETPVITVETPVDVPEVGVITVETPVITAITPEKPAISTQIKGKEIKVNEIIWNKNPKSDVVLELPEKYINSVIEQIKFTKSILVSSETIKGMFQPFKNQNLDGIKYFESDTDVFKYFVNWIKKQDFKQEAAAPVNNLLGGRKIFRP